MNKIYITLFLFVISMCSLLGQEKAMFIGGNIGFNYSNNNVSESALMRSSSKLTELSASPFWGYYLSNKLSIGVAAEYHFIKNNQNEQNLKTKQSDLIIAPFLRVFIVESLFTQIQLNIGSSSIKHEGYQSFPPEFQFEDNKIDFDYSGSNFILGAGLGLGYDIRLTDNLMLEPLIKYYYNSYMTPNDGGDNYTNSQVLLNIGFIYNF